MEKLTGHGIPSAHLVGEVGQHYEDLDTGDLYECRIAEQYSPTHGWPVGGYVWEKRATGEDIQELFGSGGGSGGMDFPFLTPTREEWIQYAIERKMFWARTDDGVSLVSYYNVDSQTTEDEIDCEWVEVRRYHLNTSAMYNMEITEEEYNQIKSAWAAL